MAGITLRPAATRGMRVCDVLTCFAPYGGTTLNSRGYCTQHEGLALFTGLRHTSQACHLWSMLGMKGKLGLIGGHRHNTMESLADPVQESTGQTDGVHWRVYRFCAPNMRHGPVTLIGATPRQTYVNPAGQSLLVPPYSLCHFTFTGLVDAWLKAEYRDVDGNWVPVTTQARYTQLFKNTGWDKGWLGEVTFCRGKQRNTRRQ